MIILFGANGQLGQELVYQARRTGVPLIAFGHQQVDITDSRAVAGAIDQSRIKLVINAAAYTKVDQAESEPEEAFKVNSFGAAVIAEVCANLDLPLVHISSDYVFDGSLDCAYREDDPIAPRSVYGQSKAEGDQAVQRSNPKHLILRTAWLYGVYGHNFLKTILRLAAEQNELRVVADQWGSPTCATELAQAILRIAPKLGSVPWGTYHFAGSGETTWYGFASRIVESQARFTGKRPKLKAIATSEFPTKARRPQYSVLDNSRFTAVFGFRPEQWELAVDRTVNELFVEVER
jgi:dTDP-4-dehydrorhamnose reductase